MAENDSICPNEETCNPESDQLKKLRLERALHYNAMFRWRAEYDGVEEEGRDGESLRDIWACRLRPAYFGFLEADAAVQREGGTLFYEDPLCDPTYEEDADFREEQMRAFYEIAVRVDDAMVSKEIGERKNTGAAAYFERSQQDVQKILAQYAADGDHGGEDNHVA